jgi:hypothetical protein
MSKSYKHDEINHPLVEAPFDTAFKVYKSDRKKAVIGDPGQCIEAVGLRRLPNVAFAHIGSGGDAYVGFKDPDSHTGITVRHFLIPAAAAKVRDAFDVKNSPPTQVLMLKAPTNGKTLSHRSLSNKRRRDEVKGGAPVKARGPQKNKRITRLGVAHRPRAKIVKGEVSLPTSESVSA